MSKQSAYTSVNQVPAVFKKYELGRVNLDIGGGKYDTGTKYLAEHGTLNLVYDPYNRSQFHNTNVVELVLQTQIDTITCLNVLNVVTSAKERKNLLWNIRKFVYNQKYNFNHYPPVIFSIYEKSGTGRADKNLTQNNMKTKDYIPEIQYIFPDWEIQQEGNVIIV